MKKFTISLFITAFYLSIPGFSQGDKPIVLSSASMIWDMAKNIGGDKVKHQLIVPIGGDPHLYEPTPGDARKVENADLIFVNGLTFEGWIIELIENSGTRAELDTVTNGIKAISSDTYKDSFDPHAWMDINNAFIYIDNIRKSLTELDPDNADYYRSNYEKYREKLDSLDQYIRERVAEIPEEKRVLITSHDAFKYYGKRYGLRLEAIVGISTEAEAQTSDIVRINKTIAETGVPAIFIESTINPKLIRQIAKDNNIVIGGKLYADSIGDEDSPAPSYYDMLKHNTDTIVNALSGSSAGEEEAEERGGTLIYLVIGVLLVAGLWLVIRQMNK